MLYYVRFRHAGEPVGRTWPDSAGFATVDEAKRHAGERVSSSITWEWISG